MNIKYAIVIYVTAINIIAFMAYGMDKWLAIKGKNRISEKTLIGYSVAGGSLGAIIAMVVCHHKISKKKFYALVPLMMVVQYSICAYLIVKYLSL